MTTALYGVELCLRQRLFDLEGDFFRNNILARADTTAVTAVARYRLLDVKSLSQVLSHGSGHGRMLLRILEIVFKHLFANVMVIETVHQGEYRLKLACTSGIGGTIFRPVPVRDRIAFGAPDNAAEDQHTFLPGVYRSWVQPKGRQGGLYSGVQSGGSMTEEAWGATAKIA